MPSPKDFSKKIADLEKKMYKYADDMEFEKAAQLRDEIAMLKKRVFAWISFEDFRIRLNIGV